MPTSLVVLVSLMAAACNAAAALLQRRGAGAPAAHELFRRDFILTVSKNRIWLLGLIMQLGAGVLQAAALYSGSLVLVEPLLTTDLIFLLIFLNLYYNLSSGPREWGAVAAVITGLTCLLAAADPRGGHVAFNGLYWGITTGIIGGLVLISIFWIHRSSSPVIRAGIGGFAAGIGFALTAAFTKLVMEQLHYGVPNVFSSWELYALLVSSAVSILVAQSAYAAGPLAFSQPTIEIVDPLVSALIGVLLFADIISTDIDSLVFEGIGATLAILGIVLMGTSKRILQSHTELKL